MIRFDNRKKVFFFLKWNSGALGWGFRFSIHYKLSRFPVPERGSKRVPDRLSTRIDSCRGSERPVKGGVAEINHPTLFFLLLPFRLRSVCLFYPPITIYPSEYPPPPPTTTLHPSAHPFRTISTGMSLQSFGNIIVERWLVIFEQLWALIILSNRKPTFSPRKLENSLCVLPVYKRHFIVPFFLLLK